jgi:molybdopterin-guanine dinucleotide biosynthesis protein A
VTKEELLQRIRNFEDARAAYKLADERLHDTLAIYQEALAELAEEAQEAPPPLRPFVLREVGRD